MCVQIRWTHDWWHVNRIKTIWINCSPLPMLIVWNQNVPAAKNHIALDPQCGSIYYPRGEKIFDRAFSHFIQSIFWSTAQCTEPSVTHTHTHTQWLFLENSELSGPLWDSFSGTTYRTRQVSEIHNTSFDWSDLVDTSPHLKAAPWVRHHWMSLYLRCNRMSFHE